MTPERFNKLLALCKRTHTDQGAAAFIELYEYSTPIIVKHIRKKYRQDIGSDIAHNFFEALLRRTINFVVLTPKAWLKTVSDNFAKNYFKIDSRQNGIGLKGLPLREEPDPFDKTLYRECLLNMQVLDRDTRNIIIMHCIEGYNSYEIADKMGMKAATVRQRYARGLKKLRNM